MTSQTNARALDRSRAVVYARVSTEGQNNDGDLEVQLYKIVAWANQNGIAIEQVFQEVQDGALSSKVDRPQLHECLRTAIEGGYVVVALDPSRITRNAAAAQKLAERLPERFRFVNRAIGFEDLSWPEEVREKHSRLQSDVSTGTMIAMDKMKREGRVFGGPDRCRAGRAASIKVRGVQRLARVKAIADFLADDPTRLRLTCRELAKVLDAVGVSPAQGGSWSVSALRRPLKDALKLLAERQAQALASRHGGLTSVSEDASCTELPGEISVSARTGSSEPVQGIFGDPRTGCQPLVGVNQSGTNDKPAGNPDAQQRDLTDLVTDQLTLDGIPLWGRF